MGIPESTKGSLGSPSRFLCMLFFVFREVFCCFWQPGPSHLFERPPFGIKSKRIFLSADIAFILSIQPVPELPEGSFIVLCLVASAFVFAKDSESYPLQKNLLAAPLSVLFLSCQSRYVLFLLDCCVCCSCCSGDIAEPVPVFVKAFEIRALAGFWWLGTRPVSHRMFPCYPFSLNS